jgi:SPP1 gp7 family putative phage head morphogenesis protein
VFWEHAALPKAKAAVVKADPQPEDQSLTPQDAILLKQAVQHLTGGVYAEAIYDEMAILVEAGWASAKQLLDLSASFETAPSFLLDAIREQADQFGFLVNDRESDALIDAIDNAVATGATPAELSSTIGQLFSSGYHSYQDGELVRTTPTDVWTKLVARTELSRAQTMGAVALYRAASIQKVMWVTTEGANVCDICEPADGQIENLGDDFESVDVSQPPAHPNCCCALIPADEDVNPEPTAA